MSFDNTTMNSFTIATRAETIYRYINIILQYTVLQYGAMILVLNIHNIQSQQENISVTDDLRQRPSVGSQVRECYSPCVALKGLSNVCSFICTVVM